MRWRKWLLEALCGFVLWTLFLTPYMIWIVNVTPEQYGAWLLMQCILVPPVAIPVVNITNWMVKRFGMTS